MAFETSGKALRNPLVAAAVALSTGISLAAQPFKIPISAVLILAAIAAVICFAVRRTKFLQSGLAIFFILVGASASLVESSLVPANSVKALIEDGRLSSGETVELEGTVEDGPEPTPYGSIYVLRATKVSSQNGGFGVTGRVRLTVEDDAAEPRLAVGQHVRLTCSPRREESYSNPGVASRLELLDQKGIDATASVDAETQIELIGSSNRISPMAWAKSLRLALIDELRTRFSTEAAGVLIASSLGNKYFLDRDTSELFREGGTFHVLVISGLHITFLGGLLMLAARKLFSRRSVQASVTVGFLWLFALAVGGETPVVRAALMFTVFTVGYVIDRRSSPLNALALSVIILLLWKPSQLLDASFQLTVVSVAGIVGIALPLLTKLRAAGNWRPTTAEPFPPNLPRPLLRVLETIYWRGEAWEVENKREIWSARLVKRPYLDERIGDGVRRWLAYAVDGIVVSLVVQISMLPLLVVYFHRVSFVSVFLNLWVGVLLAAETFAAAAALAVGMLHEVPAAPFVMMTELISDVLLFVSSVVTSIDAGSIRVPVYSGLGRWVYAAYFLYVAVAAVTINRWDPFKLTSKEAKPRKELRLMLQAGVVLAALAVVILVHPLNEPRPDGRLRIHFLDVGQGDAAFVQFPSGKTMLIDGGGRFEGRPITDATGKAFVPDVPRIGEMVVSEFLWEMGYSRVDLLVASHGDADHAQGLIDIARNFDVAAAYVAEPQLETEVTRELFDELQAGGVPVVRLVGGDVMEVEGVRIEVVHRFTSDKEKKLSGNDRSLVLRIVHGENAFLFTGDIEQAAEKLMVESAVFIEADVVKVPHHGSRTSSTAAFIAATKATTAVFSVGQRSLYGHPHAEVVERWENAGAKVYITGTAGTVTAISDGTSLQIKTFR